MTTLILKSPLAGWCLPLSQVPDPVFAERMAGDGVALDPTGNMLYAPCDGEIVPMPGAKHALTVRNPSGHDILLHIGIDTVQLAGEGFESLVQAGQQVTAGQALLRFDLSAIPSGAVITGLTIPFWRPSACACMRSRRRCVPNCIGPARADPGPQRPTLPA